MTREDIDNIIGIICPNDEDFEKPIISPAYLKKELETLALEEEPSGDLISRQAVLEQTYNWSKDEFLRVTNPFDYLRKRIMDLPSVNPQEPKTGHWIEKDGFDGDTYYDCSECGESFCLIDGTPTDNLYNYCPNCGAKMVEQERSDKE